MGVNLTEKAAEHVVSYLEGRGKGIGIRLAVKTTGCSICVEVCPWSTPGKGVKLSDIVLAKRNK